RDAYGDFPGCGTSTNACSEQTVLPAATEPIDGHIHSYVSQTIGATCTQYEKVRYTCSLCEHSYETYPEHLFSQWQEDKPIGMDESLIETKTVYRYADREVTQSDQQVLEGYTLIGSTWKPLASGSVQYVSSWPSGFSTTSALYSQYNQKNQKVTAYETETTRRTIDGDSLCGYLYYHWCYSNSYYSTAYKTGSYTTFHAYFSSTAPSNYVCDTSDMSYKTSHSTCATNSKWFFVTNVYEQCYTDYTKLYTHERWSDWSDWSNQSIEETADRKVEVATLYRYVNGTYAPHCWNGEGVCTLCGGICTHHYQNNICIDCGCAKPVYDYYLFGWINGVNYGCEENADSLGDYCFADGKVVVFFTEDSYVGVKASDNLSYYMTDGWQGYVSSVTLYNTVSLESADKLFVPGGTEVTFTLIDNGDDTLHLSYVAVECSHPSHTTDGVCTLCGDAVAHSYDAEGFCGCGAECSHTMSDGSCTVCGKACAHSYQNNVCTICAQAKPLMDYYLFGYINGADYGCEADYANLGQYKFVDGQIAVKFTSDSYVAVKAEDNLHWYMTDGWQGQVTSATLYNSKVLAVADKLFVPGGRLVTFTLIDNGDDTYILSYEAVCTHDSHNMDGLCADCGEQVLHRYQNNVCTVCGYEKPEQDYYLFGWINGVDYADKDDKENLGIYRFEDGALEVYFTKDSYVGVKSADNLNWYMTDGYQGQVTSVTLVNAESILTDDKLFVPANLKVTFTLSDNGDDTYILSYEAVECPHDNHNTDGICTLCGAATEHRYVEGICGCGLECVHSYQDGVCVICQMPCAHSWADGKCRICDTACIHRYQNSICTVCAFAKPVTDYYLVGQIDGADYGWGQDAASLGEYLFVDGKLSVIFRQECHICLKAGNHSGWYMTDGLQGSATSVLLYNTANITTGELLTVPGAMEITFILVDNGDDTFSLSYTAVPCAHEAHDQQGTCLKCGSAVEHTYDGVVTEPTCTTGGYTTHTCQICGISYTDSETTPVAHSWQDGTCQNCGEVCPHSYQDWRCTICGHTLTPAVQLSYPSLSFEDQIQYNVYFTLSDLDLSYVSQMGVITFAQRLEEGTVAEALGIYPGYTVNDVQYMAHTDGIPAKNLGDIVYMKVYVQLTDGSFIYSDIAGYNAVAYAQTILNGSDEKAKALVVAMLNYGAAAQEYFGYNTDCLMNAELTAQQQALVEPYHEGMVDPVKPCDKSGIFVHNGGYTKIYPTVSFEGAFAINYYFATAHTPDSPLIFYYWDADTYESVEVLTVENATGTMEMTADGNQWYGTISGIAAKAIGQTFYATATYTVDGVMYTSPVIAYSLGSYCQSVAAAGEAFGAATAVYGSYARAYFFA
ncbi:MAG: hypothetical protein IJB11_05805, partial [Oscillospiraceae bacterium]|nr:hypothetical protein [Oscillospiraceae bacterium]